MQGKPAKKKNKGWRTSKPGPKPIGEREEAQRVERRELEHSNILSSMEFLGNPFDEMNIDEKKKHALYMYYDMIKVCIFPVICPTNLYNKKLDFHRVRLSLTKIYGWRGKSKAAKKAFPLK